MQDKKKIHELLKLYESAMQEVKIRTYCILDTISNPTNSPSIIVREFCFLQLRMMCELIAIACLIAHGDLVDIKAKKLKRTYKADEIINALEALEPGFYPSPHKVTKEEEKKYHLKGIEHEYLSKEDLIKLYRKCGDVLHKGSLKKFLKNKSPIEREFKDIKDWTYKIIHFLNVHRISLQEGNLQIICMMRSRNEEIQIVAATLMK